MHARSAKFVAFAVQSSAQGGYISAAASCSVSSARACSACGQRRSRERGRAGAALLEDCLGTLARHFTFRI